MIYDKLIQNSKLGISPCAPDTLQMMARFSVLTRLKEHENSNLYSKMRVYDGESLKDTDPNARTVQEYHDAAGVTEGMDGVSTRFAYKILSETFNFDHDEVAADPVHLMYVLEKAIRREQLPEETESGGLQDGAAEAEGRLHQQGADAVGEHVAPEDAAGWQAERDAGLDI